MLCVKLMGHRAVQSTGKASLQGVSGGGGVLGEGHMSFSRLSERPALPSISDS